MTDIPKSEVSHAVPDSIDVGPPPVRLSGGRSYKGVLAIVLLVVLGGAAALAWTSYGDRISELANVTAAPASPASVGDSVSSVEFTAFQAQIQASLLAATQSVAAQQAELKRLSDQVAGLNARIDGLQGSLAAAPPPAPTQAAPTPPAPAPRPTAPRKRPASPPASAGGGISVGGAPLPGAAPAAR